jgi:heme-degrading monooxygenase HmoA
MTRYHLAQVNIARLRAPLDTPLLADFVAALTPINALADDSPGFVWRLQTENGDATTVRAFDDERILVNLSVWESLEALADFTYRSAHTAVMRRRREWFHPMQELYLALWWVPAGHQPSLDEARARLAHLDEHGATSAAFTFRAPFPPPGSARRLTARADDLCPA